MVTFNRMFTPVFFAIVYASMSNAFSNAYTNRKRIMGRGLEIDTFHPESTFQVYGDGLEQPPSFANSLAQDTIAFVHSKLGIDQKNVMFRSGYSAGTVKYAYVKQVHNGISFANAVANVGWNGNKVVSFGSSFVKPKKIPDSKPTLDVESIVARTEEALNGKRNNHPASLEYLARPDGSVALTHVIQIENEETGAWHEAFVDAHSGELLSVTDFVAQATYRVLPITKETLPEGQELLVDPQDLVASPLGWHNNGVTNTTTTAGNNVVAYKTSESSTTSQSSAGLVFDYTYNDSQAPSVASNLNAARTNAFYIINTIHDFAYRYGFTEAAYNFQAKNFGKGGKENDHVLISVQDSSGTNNANFATPADGQSGKARMYIWTLTTVQRDGSLENDIIVHEMTHGITNRMTGGGTGRCLQTTEAGGLGEGWSDALAEWTEHKSAEVKDYVLGQYVINDPRGIRNYPYSTNATTNPLRYSSVGELFEVHNIGEVWANTLHNVYAALVAAHGFSTIAKTNPGGTEGNIVWLHLFIDALALQPCNPTFISARAAWIQADQNRYGGANKCLLWTSFASRGLGVKAANYVDDTSVPAECVAVAEPEPTPEPEPVPVPEPTPAEPEPTPEPDPTPETQA